MTAFQVLEVQPDVRRLPAKGNYPEKAVDHFTLKRDGVQVLAFDFRKPDFPALKVGETIEGELGDPDRFDKDRRRFKRAGQSGGGGGRGMSPAERRRVERMNAQTRALSYIEIKASLGQLPKDTEGKQDFGLEDVAKLADWFNRDTSGLPEAKSDVPGDTTGLPDAYEPSS